MEREVEFKDTFATVDEETPDSFVCCICLDLIYKPIVLSCGHISCFWCVNESMSGVCESRCPICRHSYNHFPSICWMLHFLLLKKYPFAYKRREKQTLVDEKRTDYFSPQFHCDEHGLIANTGCNYPCSCPHSLTSIPNSSLDHCSLSKGEPCEQIDSACVELDGGITGPGKANVCKTVENSGLDGKNLPQESTNENHQQLSAADIQCVACKLLLFRPVILNCGHAYCETCIPSQVNEVPRCQVCQSLHPSAFPKVYLELHHFLEVQFPREYALRRYTAQMKNQDVKTESTSACSTMSGADGFPILSAPTADHITQPSHPNPMVHFAVGCDFCGMFPIIGDRYKCKDCVEKVGFDLCGDCYNSRSKLPGRFNQQHTPDHKFQRVDTCQYFISQLLNGRLHDFEIHFPDFDGPFSADGVPYVTVSEDDTWNRQAAPILQTDNGENEEDTQSSLAASDAHTRNEEDQHDMPPTS